VLTATAVAKLAETYDGTMRVHYVGADSHVHELRIAEGIWVDADLTSAAGGPSVTPGTAIASVADKIYGTVRVHYIAAGVVPRRDTKS